MSRKIQAAKAAGPAAAKQNSVKGYPSGMTAAEKKKQAIAHGDAVDPSKPADVNKKMEGR